ncbi:efflux RND transporter periplasmic adaptor subunit [Paracoccus caeni]|uniref:Efflux RND transporter periplasmic adaptor subunit n=1 Tax=Paracoccus caeni TaxID=657651 RepID=A0A934W1K6_9RHOB|nr:efflux RND transporter periplasmic adaptor subunit [Paracoccus caeni]MBK4218130.1 efflux RND transporter periplasmic adaptor subunit [Paracoccus caeni]
MRAVKAALGLVVVLAAAVGGLYLSDRLLAAPEAGIARPAAADHAPLRVETVPVEMVDFSDSIRAVGTARARHAVDLVPDTGGRIARITFEPGDEVAANDVLLQLDDRAEQADLNAAEATLAEAEAAFARQEQLNRSGSASDAAYQTARAARLRAEAERDRAMVALEDRSLRAPFAGVVGLTDLVEGQLIDATTKVATLDDLSVIEVDFSVPETLLPRLKRGQRIDLTSSAWPGRVFQGHISRIDSRVDAATRSVALRADIPNDDRALAGGMFLQVELVLDEYRRPAIPERALSVEGERNLVMVANGGTAEQVDIAVGQQAGDLVEVISGLDADARIIVTNLHRLAPGMAVEAVPQDVRAEAGTTGSGG